MADSNQTEGKPKSKFTTFRIVLIVMGVSALFRIVGWEADRASTERGYANAAAQFRNIVRKLCGLSSIRFPMRHLPLLLAILFVSPPTSAASAREEAARKFIDLLRYENQFIKYRETCIATQRTVSPSALVAQNPSYFGGIGPSHKQWPIIVTAYETYFQEACSRPTKAEFLESLSASYAEVLSEQQLKEAIAFYSTSTGQALVSAHTFATTALYQKWTEINGKHLTKATARFQAELARLVQSK